MFAKQTGWFRAIVAACFVALAFPAAPAVAQSKATSKTDSQPVLQQAIPLAVLCVAGVERWLSNVDYVFSAIKREELSDFVGGQLANVNDLKGIDKDKPFGLLIFLKPTLIPQPYPVAFAPVKKLSDLLGTLSGGPIKVKKIDDTHYDLVLSNETWHAKLQGDYAWLAQEIEQLEYDFPDPADYTRRLAERYDLSLEFNLTQVPEGMKNIFLDFLRASTETSMQQRDDEPEVAYQLRRLNALNILDDLDLLVTQGERLTFGLSMDRKIKRSVIEVDLMAKRDSALSRLMQDVSARSSYFGNVLRSDAPMSFSMSWMLPPAHQKRLGEFFESAEQAAAEQFAFITTGAKPKPPEAAKPAETTPATGVSKFKRGASNKPKKAKVPVPPAIKDVFDSLRTTASVGHVDFFIQFLSDDRNSKGSPVFTLVGGAKVADGTKLGGAINEILRQIKGKEEAKLALLDLNFDSHNGVTFHRVRGSEIGRGEELMYGGKPTLYVGLGSQAVYFSIGQTEALAQLKKIIDRVQEGPVERPGIADRMPFQFVWHMKRWMEFGQANGAEFRAEAEARRAEAIAAQETAAAANGAKPTPKAEEPRGVRVEIGTRQGFRAERTGGNNRENNQPNNNDPNRRSPRDRWEDMQRQAFQGDDDGVHVNFKPTEQGGRLRVELDEGFLRLMGLGASMGIDAASEAERRSQERRGQSKEGAPRK